jgi:hypothetical protein
VCEICQLACLSRSALSKHELTHTGERPHGCTFANCGKKFVQKSHLNYHIKVVHGPPIGYHQYQWVLITMAVFLMKLAVNNLAVFLIKWQ